jgi:hypothetical protein
MGSLRPDDSPVSKVPSSRLPSSHKGEFLAGNVHRCAAAQHTRRWRLVIDRGVVHQHRPARTHQLVAPAVSTPN